MDTQIMLPHPHLLPQPGQDIRRQSHLLHHLHQDEIPVLPTKPLSRIRPTGIQCLRVNKLSLTASPLSTINYLHYHLDILPTEELLLSARRHEVHRTIETTFYLLLLVQLDPLLRRILHCEQTQIGIRTPDLCQDHRQNKIISAIRMLTAMTMTPTTKNRFTKIS